MVVSNQRLKVGQYNLVHNWPSELDWWSVGCGCACTCLYVSFGIAQMAVAGVKIAKPGGAKLDKFEESVSQVRV